MFVTQQKERDQLKALRLQITALEREQKSIPLTLENVDRKQSIQDALRDLNAQFTAISRTIKTH